MLDQMEHWTSSSPLQGSGVCQTGLHMFYGSRKRSTTMWLTVLFGGASGV